LKNNSWFIHDLSNDHKPDVPAEKKRILSRKGRIEQYVTSDGELVGPFRVWITNE